MLVAAPTLQRERAVSRAILAGWLLAAACLWLLCAPGGLTVPGVGSARAATPPSATDFELAVRPSAQRGGSNAAASASATSFSLNPRRPFALVGLSWSNRGDVTIRVQSHGPRGWSDWVTVEADADHSPDLGGLTSERQHRQNSDPVWTGKADALRIKVSRPLRELRAHFVAVKQSRTHVAMAASTGGTSIGGPGVKAPATGRAADAAVAPAFVTRTQWGADTGCKPRTTPGYADVFGAVVHHTVSTNTYSLLEAPGVVLAICRYHRNSNGWYDVGYNALIDRFGTIYEGRAGGVDRGVIGAHAQGYNGQTTGVALIGNHTSETPSLQAIASLRGWLDWKLRLHGITRSERVALNSTGGKVNRFANGKLVFTRPISGHRDFNSTSCPGETLYSQLIGLQSIFTPNVRVSTRASLNLRKGAKGSKTVVLSGRLRGGGSPLQNFPIEVQTYGNAGWTTLQTVTTDVDGIWRTTVPVTSRIYLRGTFMGNDTYRAVRSVWKPTR